jgi:hypothetical protein
MQKVMMTPTQPSTPLIIEDPRYSRAKMHLEDPEGIKTVKKTQYKPQADEKNNQSQ